MEKESIRLYEDDTPSHQDDIEIIKGRNYKDALQNLYDKTKTTLTRNNIDSAHKESKTKTESSMFTMNCKLEDKDDIKDTPSHPLDSNYFDLINKLKQENLKLKEENTRLQLSYKQMEKSHIDQMTKMKDQSLHMLRSKESEFNSLLQQKEKEFQVKLTQIQSNISSSSALHSNFVVNSFEKSKSIQIANAKVPKKTENIDLLKMKKEIAKQDFIKRIENDGKQQMAMVRKTIEPKRTVTKPKEPQKPQRNTLSPGRSSCQRLKERADTIQKLACPKADWRDKSRMTTSGLRYTNSLPEDGRVGKTDQKFRQIIDRLGGEESHERIPITSHCILFEEDTSYRETNLREDLGVSDTEMDKKKEIEYLLSKSDIRQLSYESSESEDDSEQSSEVISKTRSSNESYNNRVEVYHLEDLENQVIEEKAEEEETSSVYIYSNKPHSEEFSSLAAAEVSDDDSRILDESSVSRRSINTSQINFKRICIS